MENAQLISLSRQVALRREMNVIAHNVANINTTGFKAENMVFEEYLMPVAKAHTFPAFNRDYSYVQDVATVHDMKPGSMVNTGGATDVAIMGKEGFFVIDTPKGEQYTRNGAFLINAEGELVTNDGHKVLGEDGPIVFGNTDSNIAIARDGTISASSGVKGKLRLVKFDNPQALTREGDSLFAGKDPQPMEFVNLRQGIIEKSNVSPVLEISRMIQVNRAYASVTNMQQKTSDLHKSAIEKLGTAPA